MTDAQVTETRQCEKNDIIKETRAKAELLYRQVFPYRMARQEECPAVIKLLLMINRWSNPWHACTDLEKVIPARSRQEIVKSLNIRCK